jgi:hypothetical protein
MMIDFNSSAAKEKVASEAINEIVEAAQKRWIKAQPPREYLGASSLGHECLRRIQLDWLHPIHPEPRIERIFSRGRWWEKYAGELMSKAGFAMIRSGSEVAFSQVDGAFKGHADAIIYDGPHIDGVAYPCLWECKGLGSKGWNKLAKGSLRKEYPVYYDQCQLYMAYLELTAEPAIFTACNMDTMELLHLTVPFDSERAQAASDRAVLIVRAMRANEELPKIRGDGDGFPCTMCGHKERCWP